MKKALAILVAIWACALLVITIKHGTFDGSTMALAVTLMLVLVGMTPAKGAEKEENENV